MENYFYLSIEKKPRYVAVSLHAVPSIVRTIFEMSDFCIKKSLKIICRFLQPRKNRAEIDAIRIVD